MYKDSIAINNEIKKNEARIKDLFESEQGDEAIRLGGVNDALRAQLDEALEYEASLRQEQSERLQSLTKGTSAPKDHRTAAQIFLGPRDTFKGFSLDEKRSAIVDAAVDLPTPEVIEEGFPTTTLAPMGFVGSLAQGRTAGDITFPAPAADSNRLVAEAWKKGDKKAEGTLSWDTKKAHVEMIAFTLPVEQVALMDYGQLESIIRTELMNGYLRAQAFYGTHGKNASGIQGILDSSIAVPKFTKRDGDTAFDTIRRMITRVVFASGRIPNTVCMNPLVSEELDLTKVGEGRNDYLGLKLSGGMWNLRMVDDVYMADDEFTNGYALVYDSSAATWFTQHGVKIDMGYVNDQFLYNRVTFRIEGSHALKVADPLGFMYTEFAIDENDTEVAKKQAVKPKSAEAV